MLSILLVMLAQAPVTAPAVAHTYNNAKFGYTMCYPASMHAVSGRNVVDGQTFRDGRGATITTFGEYNVTNDTLVGHDMETADQMDEILTQTVKPGWKTQMGRNANSFFWRRVFQKGDRFVTVELRFPQRQIDSYLPVVNALSRCVVMGRAAY